MTDQHNDLKPCPICGAVMIDFRPDVIHHPKDCPCPMTGMALYPEHWNTRAEPRPADIIETAPACCPKCGKDRIFNCTCILPHTITPTEEQPTIKPGLQVQVSEPVGWLIQNPDRSKSEAWTAEDVEKFDPLPAYRENGWHVTPLFSDQSAVIEAFVEHVGAPNFVEARDVILKSLFESETRSEGQFNKIKELGAEIKRLTVSLSNEIVNRAYWAQQCVDKDKEIERLRAENSYNFGKLQDAKEALEPFVEVADFYDGTIHNDEYVVDSYAPHGKSPFKIHLGDYRKAREAVRPAKHSENKQLRERVKALEVENESLKSNQPLGINSNHAQ